MFPERADILLNDDTCLSIYFTPESGKVFWRWKIDTVFGVKHPGIYNGQESNGRHWFMHNHLENGSPCIVDIETFSKQQVLYAGPENSINPPLQTFAVGLQQVLDCKPYEGLLYNCQSFVNRARNNNNISEAVQDTCRRNGRSQNYTGNSSGWSAAQWLL